MRTATTLLFCFISTSTLAHPCTVEFFNRDIDVIERNGKHELHVFKSDGSYDAASHIGFINKGQRVSIVIDKNGTEVGRFEAGENGPQVCGNELVWNADFGFFDLMRGFNFYGVWRDNPLN